MYIEYPSTQDPGLRLFAAFRKPPEPRRILVEMHGWHGQVKRPHSDNLFDPHPDWFLIQPEMRGRGDSTGKPDCNGWELQDVMDAVEFARREFSDRVRDPELVTLVGGSGGGANVFSLLGKFPDAFCRARSQCGVSDFAMWHRQDEVGEFRDEMECQGWIGGDPDDRPEAYASRSGITTVANLLTPLLIFHGEKDPRCPVTQSRRYAEEARRLGKGDLVTYYELEGVGLEGHWGGITPAQQEFRRATDEAFLGKRSGPVAIPRQGRFVIGGFVKTKVFEVILDSIDHIGEVVYDLDADRFDIAAPTAASALLRVRRDGAWKERAVVPHRRPVEYPTAD